MNRGEVRYYTFKPPDKRRPVLLLTRPSILPHLETVTVAAITRSIRQVASEVVLTESDGVPEACAINLHHLHTVQKSRLGRLITTLSTAKMEKVHKAILYALGFDDPLSQ